MLVHNDAHAATLATVTDADAIQPSQPLIPEQRQQELLRMLREEGVLSTRALTEAMQVSHMTVRRDIAALEAAGQVVAVQGGVRIATRSAKEPPRARTMRSTLEVAAKATIAAAGARHVEDGMVVFLDAGTTCEAVVPHLAGHTSLTVVTSDFNSVNALAHLEHIDVIHTGGIVDRDRSSANGPLAAATVRSLAIDLYLVSTGSWDTTYGITVPVADTALLKRAVFESSAAKILLADSSKFGAFERYRVAPLSSLDAIITDNRLPQEDRDAVTATGVHLELVTA